MPLQPLVVQLSEGQQKEALKRFRHKYAEELTKLEAELTDVLTSVAEAEFPAKSVALPVTLWSVPSFDRVDGPLVEARPERASDAAKETVTSELFQPFALASGSRLPTIEGGVLSMLIPFSEVETALPALSEHVP